MSSHAQQARTLVEALPYIQKFTGKTIVVKYGGNAMVSDELRRAVMCDIILLSLVGIRVVVVHGGGPEISEMLKKLGHESRFVDGLRYTDAETMDVVQSVLCGKVNKNLVAQLNRLGGQAIGLCGMDGQLFQAEQLDEKYGLVGKITGVNPEPVENALLSGYIPVVSTVAQGVDADTAYNINADTAASKLAAAMGAEKLILLTDVRGLLRNPRDEETLIHVDQGRGDADPRGPHLRRAGPGGPGHHLRGHDPQDGVLCGRHRRRRGAGPHPGRTHSPFHSH